MGMRHDHNIEQRKRPVKLTIRSDILEEAKLLELNASQAAEAGIAVAVTAARENAWREDNRAAIKAYNKSIAREGLSFPILWPDD
jgi:antitoxin CcdA